MLFNHLKIALRRLYGNALYSLINIIGLTIGLATCLLITSFVLYENSYDKALEKANHTYRIHRHYADEGMHLAAIAAPFMQLIESRIDAIESIGRLGMTSSIPLSYNDYHTQAEDVLLADSSIFSVLPFEFIIGKPEKSLDKFNTAVLTESAAKKFFGEKNPLGKHLIAYENQPIEVTGVIKDLPHNTHLHFNILLSLENMRVYAPYDFVNWDFNNFYTYIRIKKGEDPKKIERKISSLLGELEEDITQDQSLTLLPIGDIHLHSQKMYEMKKNGSFILTISFSVIAAIILLIACINFMNLSTAQASYRAKEVGIRKTIGANQAQLIFQFLIESTLITFIAMLAALAIVEISSPIFSEFIKKPLSISFLYTHYSLMAIGFCVIIIGLFAGGYPAFYLSSFRPGNVLKVQRNRGIHALNLRKALVILQFSLSSGLIIATTIVIKQTEFLRNQNPGYEKENTIIVPMSFSSNYKNRNDMYYFFRKRLLENDNIISVAGAQQLPTTTLRDIWSYVPEDQNIVSDNMVTLPTLNSTYHFFEHYRVPLLAGRYFSEELGDQYVKVPSEENPIGSGVAILSESAAAALSYSAKEAINKIIKIPFPPGSTNYHIVGVVEDIQFGSLKDESTPQVYHLVKNEERFISIRFKREKEAESIAHIENAWSETVSGRPIKTFYLDEKFQSLYQSEDKQAQVFMFFSILSIIIACMGLFGLAAFTTDKRKKEIGIRKTLGASVSNIVLLLTREFTLLVIAANAIAWPITYWLMQDWLNQFNKSIDLNLFIFITSGAIALVIAWLTVASHAIKSAIMRPLTSIRNE